MRSASGRRQSKRLEERIAASQTVVFRGRGGLAYYEQATKFGADNVSSSRYQMTAESLER